jgi:hypothetical protein
MSGMESIPSYQKLPEIEQCPTCGTLYQKGLKDRVRLPADDIKRIVRAANTKNGEVEAGHGDLLHNLGMVEWKPKYLPRESKKRVQDRLPHIEAAKRHLDAGRFEEAEREMRRAREITYDAKRRVYCLTAFGRKVARWYAAQLQVPQSSLQPGRASNGRLERS